MHSILSIYVAIIGTYSNTHNITMISDVLKFNLIFLYNLYILQFKILL